MYVAKSSTDGNLSKRIVAQRQDLCEMGINRLGHVLFHSYVFAELVKRYQSNIHGNFHVWNRRP